ncbi:hypothetical protein ABMB44_12480 [Levilactobacillus brevis]
MSQNEELAKQILTAYANGQVDLTKLAAASAWWSHGDPAPGCRTSSAHRCWPSARTVLPSLAGGQASTPASLSADPVRTPSH